MNYVRIDLDAAAAEPTYDIVGGRPRSRCDAFISLHFGAAVGMYLPSAAYARQLADVLMVAADQLDAAVRPGEAG